MIRSGNFKMDKRRFCENLVSSSLKQMLVDGFFHADPHPANIVVLPHNRLALLDFGITGFIGENYKENMELFLLSYIDDDYEQIPDILLNLGFITEPVDTEKLKEDFMETLLDYKDTSVKDIKLSAMMSKLIITFRENKIKVPANLILLMKTLMTLESDCSLIDTELSFIQVAKPFIKKEKSRRKSPKFILRKTESYANRVLGFINQLPVQSEQAMMERKGTAMTVQAIDKDVKNLGVSINRLSSNLILGFIVVALIIGSVLMMPYSSNLLLGMPMYSFVYLMLAVVLMFYILFSNIHKTGYGGS
ncbi:hypothetical protein KY320_04205, partial [Candidatus Woesearchaeota archaeon]|nr:hypothetical protein [Candidatus Woesearchaeota archaeon]